MDIKAKIDELYKKITSNKDVLANFKSNPVKTVEGLIGVDLPDEQLKGIVDGIKAKMNLDDAGSKIGDIAGKLGGLFGKK